MLNYQDERIGYTPVQCASISRPGLVDVLVTAGADLLVGSRWYRGRNFFFIALSQQWTLSALVHGRLNLHLTQEKEDRSRASSSSETLTEACRIVSVDPDNVTLLMLASKELGRGHFDWIYKAWTQFGLDFNARSKKGKTALFYAPNARVVKLLLQAGCDHRIRDNQGRTAIQYLLLRQKHSRFIHGGVSIATEKIQTQADLEENWNLSSFSTDHNILERIPIGYGATNALFHNLLSLSSEEMLNAKHPGSGLNFLQADMARVYNDLKHLGEQFWGAVLSHPSAGSKVCWEGAVNGVPLPFIACLVGDKIVREIVKLPLVNLWSLETSPTNQNALMFALCFPCRPNSTNHRAGVVRELASSLPDSIVPCKDSQGKCLLHYFLKFLRTLVGSLTRSAVVPTVEPIWSRLSSQWDLPDNSGVTPRMLVVQLLPLYQKMELSVQKCVADALCRACHVGGLAAGYLGPLLLQEMFLVPLEDEVFADYLDSNEEALTKLLDLPKGSLPVLLSVARRKQSPLLLKFLTQLDEVSGNSKLHRAIQGGSLTDVSFLLELGADPTLSNRQGKNAMELLLERAAHPSLQSPADQVAKLRVKIQSRFIVAGAQASQKP